MATTIQVNGNTVEITTKRGVRTETVAESFEAYEARVQQAALTRYKAGKTLEAAARTGAALAREKLAAEGFDKKSLRSAVFAALTA